jgi:hypothetical protein
MLGYDTTAVLPSGIVAVTCQSPRLFARRVCRQPVIGAQTLFPIRVPDVVPVTAEYLSNGPQEP